MARSHFLPCMDSPRVHKQNLFTEAPPRSTGKMGGATRLPTRMRHPSRKEPAMGPPAMGPPIVV